MKAGGIRRIFIALLASASGIHGFERTASVDLTAPTHFILSPFVGIGPFLDLKPSLKIGNRAGYFLDLEGDLGIFDKGILAQYQEEVMQDSAVAKGPEIIGNAYGLRGGIGKDVFAFGTSKIVSAAYLAYVQADFRGERIRAYRDFFGKRFRDQRYFSIGWGGGWEIKIGVLTFGLSGTYFLPLGVRHNPVGLMDNLLPYSGFDSGLKMGISF